MDILELTELVEDNTGAIFMNSIAWTDAPGMAPINAAFSSEEFDEVDRFWMRFFTAEAQFDNQGVLTEESAQNILTHLEAIQAQARALSLAIIYEPCIMPPHITEIRYQESVRRIE